MNLPVRKIGIPVIAIAIFVGVMLLLSFYFFYTISNNRQAIEEQGFRELNQLCVAVKTQDDFIRKMVSNYSPKITDTIGKMPVAGKKPNGNLKNRKSTTRGTFSDEKSLSLDMYEKSAVTKNIIIDTRDPKNEAGNMVYPVTGEKDLVCRISFKDFLSPYLRKDFFTDFILIRNDTLAFSTTLADLFIAPSGETKSKPVRSSALFSFVKSDDISDTSYNKFIQSGTIHKVRIEGTKYELFLIPVKFKNDDHGVIFIGGMIPEDKISAWEKDLPANWVMIILIILLFILFSLPIIKIFIAGGNEKITRTLVTMVGTSVVVGLLLITVFAADMLIERRTKTETDQNLKTLNDTILKLFNQERTSVLEQLSDYNMAGKDTSAGKTCITSLLDSDHGRYNPAYRYFKTMFWADKNGKQTFYITPYPKLPSFRIGYRKYFKNPEVYEALIRNRQMWYNMEPVISNTSGEWILAFSTPAHDQRQDRIVAITSWMYSIKSTILPKDYEYCLVEKSGRIWYHSGEVFNLTDNLLDECGNEDLNAEFSSNLGGFQNVTLRNNPYRNCVQPVSNTNLFLVTMFNHAGIKTIEAITAGSAILYFGLIAMILMVLFFLMRLGRMRNKLLSESDFFFDFLIPVEKKKEVYAFLLLFNGFSSLLFLIAGLSGWIRSISLSWVLWDIIFLIAGNFIFNIVMLNLQPAGEEEFTDGFITRNLGHLKKWLRPIKVRMGELIGHAPVYRKNVRNLYTSFLVSWLLLNTVLPAIFFMVRFHHEETKHYIVNQFMGIADRLNQRTDSLARFYKDNIPLQPNDSLFYERDKQGLYFQSIWNTKLKRKETSPGGGDKETDFAAIYSVHSFFNKLMKDDESSYSNPLLDARIKVTNTSYGVAFKRDIARYPLQAEKDGIVPGRESAWQCIFTTSKGGSGIFKLFDTGWTSLIFFLLAGLVLTLVHLLIRKIVHKLFDFDGLSATVPTLGEQLLAENNSTRNSIIVTLDEPAKGEGITGGWNIIDMNDPVVAEKKAAGKVILVNFEVNLLMPDEILARVRLLEKFLQETPVILMLNRTPSQLADSLSEVWENASWSDKEEASARDLLLKLSEATEYFRKVIYSLPVYFVKSRPWVNSNKPPLNEILKWENLINPEIREHEELLKSILPESKAGDKIVLTIQELSSARYSYIWNTLSKEEHFLLYEFANGALINLNNREPIRVLFNKGILRSDEKVEFTSAAFRHFILTAADLSDVAQIEKQSRKTGNWSRFRLPVMLMAASIVVFLFATQQNVLSNLNAIMLSLATLLGVYLKFSGLFVKEGK